MSPTMWKRLKALFAKPAPQEPPPKITRATGFFSTDDALELSGLMDSDRLREWVVEHSRLRPPAFRATKDGQLLTMDDSDGEGSGSGLEGLKDAFVLGQQNINDLNLAWYGSQGFIGFQICGILAQHWLVNKACTMPAKDAMRKGYDVTVNDGTKIGPDVLQAIRAADKRLNVKNNCVQAVRFNRVFGIRVILFNIVSPDPYFYERPFNPDSITPGSYKGITQVDPYWVTPELDHGAAADPARMDFYEPTWWRINGTRYHRTHLVVLVGDEVVDVLKPSYLYAGLSVPQKIYERVYAAERTANEGPQLAMTKRTTSLNVDMEKVALNPGKFMEKMQSWSMLRDNYGVKVLGEGEKLEQFDLSLSDIDAVIMTQYQIVAAVAEVPSTKLLGTTPKGFQATGEFEESSYHETLESIQSDQMEPVLDRHYLCLIRSEIAPAFGIPAFGVAVSWHPLDSPTAKEKAETNLSKAQAALALTEIGAIDGHDERARLIADPDSGYNGLVAAAPPDAEPHLPGGAQ